MKKYLLAFLMCLIIPGIVYAGVTTSTENGVPVTTTDYTSIFRKHAEWFKASSPVNTVNYVYNEAFGTDTAAGWIDTSFIFDKGSISVGVPDVGTGTVTIRIEGRVEGGDATEIISQLYSADTVIAQSFPITTYFTGIRVGALSSVGDAKSVTVEGDFINEKER